MFSGVSATTGTPVRNFDRIDFELRDQNGDNYFLQLIKKGEIKKAEGLLNDYKKYINSTNEESNSALYLAIDSNFLTLALKLIEMGANVLQYNKKGVSPLSLALDHEVILWAILNNEKIKLNSLAVKVVFCAIKKGKEQAALRFFDKGFAFPSELPGISFTAAKFALENGCQEVAKKLLTTELFSQKERYDLFEKALNRRFYDFALLLVQSIPGIDVFSEEYPYLQLACKLGTPTIARHLLINSFTIFRDYESENSPLFLAASRIDFEEMIVPFINKFIDMKDLKISINEFLFKFCLVVLKSYPVLMKDKIAEKIIQLMVPHDRENTTAQETSSPFEELFLLAVEQNCTQVISAFLTGKCAGLNIHPELLMHALSKAQLDRNESVFIQLINHLITSGWDFILNEAKDIPSLLWIYNTCFQSDLFLKNYKQLIEQLFSQIIHTAYKGKLDVLGTEIFKKALNVLSSKEIESILIRIMGLDKIKKEGGESAKAGLPEWQNVFSLLKAMGSESVHLYLKPVLPEILEHFESLGVDGHITSTDARALTKLFPEETTRTFNVQDEDTGKSQALKLNFFTLVAHSSFFRLYFSQRWSRRDFVLQANPTLFNIMYQIIDSKLELANLNPDSLRALREMADQFGVDLSILDGHSSDGNHKKSFYEKFFNNLYSFCDQRELTIDHIFSYWHEDSSLIKYFLEHTPNIEVIRLNSFEPTRLNKSSLEMIIKMLPKIKEIHINIRNLFNHLQNITHFKNFIGELSSSIVSPDCGFYFEETKHLRGLLGHRIPGFVLKGLDLSRSQELEISTHLVPLGDLQYLDLSDSRFDEKLLIEFLQKTPKLRELNLRNFSSLTDEGLLAITSSCSQLTSVNLCGVDRDKVNILQFLQNCPRLEILKVSSKTDRELEQILRVSKGLSLYLDARQVLREEDIPQEIPLLMALVDQHELYLLENSLTSILQRVLEYIAKGEKLPKDKLIIAKILKEIAERKSDSSHPLMDCIQSIKSEELKHFFVTLASCQSISLDDYLPKEFVQKLHKQLIDCQPSLSEARMLSKLFAKDKIHIFVEGNMIPFPFDSLILQSSGSEVLREWSHFKKRTVFSNSTLFSYIYRYLTFGKVDLKRSSIDAYLKICKILNEYKLSVEDFFNEVNDGGIRISLKPYTNSEKIGKFLEHPKMKEHVTMINLVQIDINSNLPSILDLVKKTINLKQIRLVANKQIPEELWIGLKEKTHKIEIILALRDYEEVKQFSFLPITEDENLAIRLEKIKDFQFPSLSEYIKFIQKCPRLLEIDASGYKLTSDSTELNEIISLCKAKKVEIFNLGDCTNVSNGDFDRIASLGLKKLICKSLLPEKIKKFFNGKDVVVDCQVDKAMLASVFLLNPPMLYSSMA